MLAAADSACRRNGRHPEETRVVNTLATTAVAAVLALGPQRRGQMIRSDIAWLQGLLSRDFNLKFN
jgi:hypothetical protein